MKKLLNLLASNRGRGASVRAEVDEAAGESTLYIYDVIAGGGWGVDPNEFVRALSEIKTPTINLRINSPGGDVFDARAIKVALAQHPSKVIAHVDGLAASAASFVMLAADEVRIAKGAFVMIHNAWALAVGNSADMDATANLLRQIDATLVDDYAAATGQPKRDIKQWMADETWFNADRAVELGFADTLYDPDAKANALSRFDLSAFDNPPNALAPPADDEIASAGARLRASAERRLALYERTAPA